MRPWHLLLLSAVLCLVSIPMAWASGSALVGRASITAIELWPVGIGSAVAVTFYLLAVLCLRWGKRLAAVVFGMFAALCSIVFTLLLIVLGSLLTRLTDLVVDDVASVSVGTGVWLVLVSGVIGLVGSVSALFAAPPARVDAGEASTDEGSGVDDATTQVGWWPKTVQLPGALWRSTREHYSESSQGESGESGDGPSSAL